MKLQSFTLALLPLAVSSQYAGNNTTSLTQCDQACYRLSNEFGTNLHYPDSDSNFTIWDAKQQEVRPACRVLPGDAADVARILQILVAESCHFAVKGGGHSRAPGDCNAILGVTLDLDRLDTVRIADDRASAQIGGGTTSAQAFAALEPHGLAFVGGRVGQVGVGGFTLGGGTFPYGNKYGWALDNTYAYEVVLANSSIVAASEDTNPDLYWALRGGANNFGIVTTFTVRTFPQGPQYVSRPVWSDNQSDAVVREVVRVYSDPTLTADLEAGMDFYFLYNAATDSFSSSALQRYETAVAQPPAVYAGLDQIPTVSRSTMNATIANMTGGGEELGTTRHVFDTLSILPSSEVLSAGMQIFREEVTAIKDVPGLAPNFICYPLPTNAIKFMKRRGGNALGIDQDEPLFIILVSTGWSNASDDTAVFTMTKNVVERMRSVARQAGVAHPYMYLNYASAGDAEKVFSGYGAANVERLKSIQAAVDPQGIFTASGLWRGFMKLW